MAEGHSLNASGYLPGPHQTSFRAELAAALHALTTARQPVHLISDCQGVVDGIKSILLGDKRPDGDDGDLWCKIEHTVGELCLANVEVLWIKSHVPVD